MIRLRPIGCLLLSALAIGVVAPAPAQQSPSEERLMEQIERARRAFQAETADAPGRPQASEQQLIEQVGQLREGLEGEAAAEGQAAPALDEAAVAELKQRLAEELGVEVLNVRPIEANGRDAYAVKVMNPGGNSNAAFLVSTLVVDGQSGEVLAQLPQSIGTAAEFPQSGARFQPNIDNGGRTIRQRTFR